MAYGRHWEWRGFGAVSPRFAKTYLLLPTLYETNKVTDEYLWIPGLEVNAKFRDGDEEGLKFKHLDQKENHFEIWIEDEDLLFEFPLQEEAWTRLGGIFEETDIRLPSYPATPPDRATAAELLKEAGCTIIKVEKERETRMLEMTDSTILVEWATITRPQYCVSIGLETWSRSENSNLADQSALETIREALPKLNIDREPLTPVNYLDAVKQWANGAKI